MPTITYCYPYKRGTGWRSQGFRSRPNQGANGPGGHTGYDQAMDAGTPLYSPCDGIVRNSSWVTDNYLENPWWLTQMGGDCLVIDATSPFVKAEHLPTFILCHLQDSIAEVGQAVRKGQLVAYSGNSGTATTGPHVHIEALPPNWDVNNGVYGRVDPETYFTEWPEDQPQGVATQGTTTIPLEDDLTTEQYNDLRAILVENQVRITAARDAAQKAVAITTENQRRIAAVPGLVWATSVLRLGKKVPALQELADVKTKLLGLEPAIADIQQNTDPAALAALIPDTLAQQVIDTLAARLGGK